MLLLLHDLFEYLLNVSFVHRLIALRLDQYYDVCNIHFSIIIEIAILSTNGECLCSDKRPKAVLSFGTDTNPMLSNLKWDSRHLEGEGHREIVR